MSNKSYTLYVVDEYRCGAEFYPRGHVLENLSEDQRDWYLRDAPGSFSEKPPEPEKKAKGKPKKADDKAVKSSKNK